MIKHRIIPLILRSSNLTWAQTRTLKTTFFLKTSSKTTESGNESTNTKSEKDKSKDMPPLNRKLPALRSPFDSIENKNKQSYLDMVSIFENRDVHRRNHVEFIYAALKCMEEFGVNRDIEVYKSLINVMPKGKFIPTNIFQAEFMHYPKQQQCIIDLLEQMEDFGVIPDYEMEAMLLNVFGRRGHPLRKYWRMMYWMPKFKNLSPWPLPNPVPDEPLELAKMAVERMCTVDLSSKIVVYDTKDYIDDAVDATWIVSGMSSEQSDLLKLHDKSKAIFIEGPFNIWLRNKIVNYFILRGDPDPKMKELDDEDNNVDDVRNIELPFFIQPPVLVAVKKTVTRSVHQQTDGTLFAICATGTSTKDSLLSWIRILEKENPILSEIPILFKFKSIIGSNIVPVSGDNHKILNDKNR